MPKNPTREFETVDTQFWKNYQQKQFSKIIDGIPKVLGFDIVPEIVHKYQKLCVFHIIVLDVNKTDKTVANTHVTGICDKYRTVIAKTEDPLRALSGFVALLEYTCKLNGISDGVHCHVEKLASTMLNKIRTVKPPWIEEFRKAVNRLIIVLVEMESGQLVLKFTAARYAITYYATTATDDTATGYSDYLPGLLTALVSCHEENAATLCEVTVKFRSLVESRSVMLRDIAIMMSQIIRAAACLISKGSILFKEKMVGFLNSLYEVIRDRNLTSFNYNLFETYAQTCCQKQSTHIGLHIMETIRTVFVGSLKANHFSIV